MGHCELDRHNLVYDRSVECVRVQRLPTPNTSGKLSKQDEKEKENQLGIVRRPLSVVLKLNSCIWMNDNAKSLRNGTNGIERQLCVTAN